MKRSDLGRTMKFESFETFGLSIWRMLGLGVAAAALVGVGLGFALGDALGEAKAATLLVIALLVFYVTVSAPRRLLDQQRVAQARESLLLSASALACLKVTGSRSRTFMLIRPRERALSAAVKGTARKILLGTSVDAAFRESSGVIGSYSAAAALEGIAKAGPTDFVGSDEESRGLATSAELGMETKLPIFMTVCFFAPIMIILSAVFSRTYLPSQKVELGAFVFVVIDLAYYLTSAERGQR